MLVEQMSMRIPLAAEAGGQSVAVTTASATTTNAIGADKVVIYSTVECFVTVGTSATVAVGIPVPANSPMRLHGFKPTDKLSFIAATGTGTAYIRANC